MMMGVVLVMGLIVASVFPMGMLMIPMRPVEVVRVAVVVLLAAMMTVEIGHVVIVILMGFIQQDGKVAGVQPGLVDPADGDFIPLHRQTGQSLTEHLFIRPQIQQGTHHHISADA
jgi:hypothetical protein